MEFISGTMYWGNFPGDIQPRRIFSCRAPCGEGCGAVEREYPHNPFRRFARGTPLLSHPMLKNTPGMPP